MPERGLDRLLLGLGALALTALVPMLWIWLLHGGRSPAPHLGLSRAASGSRRAHRRASAPR